MRAWRRQVSLRADALAFANRVHQWMISTDSSYKRSVAAGQTLRWAIPYQLKDADGNLLRDGWQVNIKSRSYEALSTTEKTEVVEIT